MPFCLSVLIVRDVISRLSQPRLRGATRSDWKAEVDKPAHVPNMYATPWAYAARSLDAAMSVDAFGTNVRYLARAANQSTPAASTSSGSGAHALICCTGQVLRIR